MAQLGERKKMVPQNSDGMIHAYLGALTTISTLILDYSGYLHIHRLTVGNNRLKKDMVVRLLDITVESYNFMAIFQGKGETCGD